MAQTRAEPVTLALFPKKNIVLSPSLKRIQTLLLPGLLEEAAEKQETTYIFYYPEPKTHTSAKAHKTACEEMSLLDTKELFDFAKPIFEMFATLLGREVESAKKEKLIAFARSICEKLDVFKDKPSIHSMELYRILYPAMQQLDELVPEIKTMELSPVVMIAFERFNVTMRGLLLNVSVPVARKQVMEKMMSEDQALKVPTSHPIRERNKKISRGKSDVLHALAEKDVSYSLLLAIATLKEMRSIVHQCVPGSISEINLLMFERRLCEARDRASLPFEEQLALYGSAKSKISTELNQLKELIEKVEPRDDLKLLSLELSTYLCGVYFHAYSRQSEPHFVEQSKQLGEVSGGILSLINLAYYFEVASLAIADLYMPRREKGLEI